VVDVDGRDPERTPIPWEPGPGAGFTTGEPWLPIDDAFNARGQSGDPRSALSLFRRAAALRRELPELQSGSQRTVEAGPDVLAWLRDERIYVAVNFAREPRPLEARGTLLLSSDPDGTGAALGPDEAVIVRLD
jgi:alpha-glucosidase